MTTWHNTIRGCEMKSRSPQYRLTSATLAAAFALAGFLALADPAAVAQDSPPLEMPGVTSTPTPTPTLQTPPTAQAYVNCEPAATNIGGRLMVPINFLSNGLGASTGPMPDGFWRVIYFN